MGKLKWLFTEGVTDLTSYRLGQVQERERIIKLLEDERLLCSNEKHCWTSVEYKCECERTRALIKGEQK